MSIASLYLKGGECRLGGWLTILFCAVFVGQSAWALAEDFPADSPHALVQRVAEELITVIEEHRPEFETNPRPFLTQVDDMLQDLVDFQWIARNVMGPYYQQSSEEQANRFAQTFRTSLVETYGQGLMNFSDESVEVVPPKGEQEDARRVSVTQRIRSGGNVYPIVYSMGLNRDQEWKVLNVIINGINLGVTFRNQFQQAAQREQGDIDRVINGWSPEVVIEADAEA